MRFFIQKNWFLNMEKMSLNTFSKNTGERVRASFSWMRVSKLDCARNQKMGILRITIIGIIRIETNDLEQ